MLFVIITTPGTWVSYLVPARGERRREVKADQGTWAAEPEKGRTPPRGPVPNPSIPQSQRWLNTPKAPTPYRNLLCAAPSMGTGGARASKAGARREKAHPTKHRGTAERERSTAPELH